MPKVTADSLVLICALMICACSPDQISAIPFGAETLYHDDYASGPWDGAILERSPAGIEAPALVASVYGDSVRIEREVDFTLKDQTRLRFTFNCSGYQRVEILLYWDRTELPRSAFTTHFRPGETQLVDIPVDGNFHGFRNRRSNDYDLLAAGDRITRIALTCNLPDGAEPSVQVGPITFYCLTEEVFRDSLQMVLGRTRVGLSRLPEELGQRKTLLAQRLDRIENEFRRPNKRFPTPVRTLLERSSELERTVGRVNSYFRPAQQASAMDAPDYCVGLESSMRRVTHASRRYRFEGEVPANPQLAAAANEHEVFQLVVMPFERFLRGLRLDCGGLTGSGGHRIGAEKIAFGRVRLVRTQHSPHSNGTDLGWTPDPIEPLDDSGGFDVSPGESQAVWVDVNVPSGTPAGEYRGTITVTADGSHSTEVPVTLEVWDYEIPTPGKFRTQGNFSIESVENFYNRKMDTEWLREWYAFWLDYRFDPVGQYAPYLTPVVELIPFCLERGLRTITLKNLNRATDVDRAWMDSVYSIVRDNDWLEYSNVLIGDETDTYERMIYLANLFHSRYPGVRVMTGGDTPRDRLIGYYDIWDPILRQRGFYSRFDVEACRQAMVRGEEVLAYVCISPHPPHINVQIEDPLVDSRTLFWMMYKYDMVGYEYWGYNVWGDNIRPPGEPRWPEVEWDSYAYDHTNGDGQICYPGPGGRPWASVRLVVHRDGIEDWEALWIMEDLARTARELGLASDGNVAALVEQARGLAEVPAEMVGDMTHFTKDPATIQVHRERVSRLIVQLQKAVGKQRADEYRQRHLAERRELERRGLQQKIERARGEIENKADIRDW